MQALRELSPAVRRFVTQYKVQLGMFSTVQVSFGPASTPNRRLLRLAG